MMRLTVGAVASQSLGPAMLVSDWKHGWNAAPDCDKNPDLQLQPRLDGLLRRQFLGTTRRSW